MLAWHVARISSPILRADSLTCAAGLFRALGHHRINLLAQTDGNLYAVCAANSSIIPSSRVERSSLSSLARKVIIIHAFPRAHHPCISSCSSSMHSPVLIIHAFPRAHHPCIPPCLSSMHFLVLIIHAFPRAHHPFISSCSLSMHFPVLIIHAFPRARCPGT
jgi:hypothetical protein